MIRLLVEDAALPKCNDVGTSVAVTFGALWKSFILILYGMIHLPVLQVALLRPSPAFSALIMPPKTGQHEGSLHRRP